MKNRTRYLNESPSSREKKFSPLRCCDLTSDLSHLTVNTFGHLLCTFRALLIATKKHVLEFQSSWVVKPCKLDPALSWEEKKIHLA